MSRTPEDVAREVLALVDDGDKYVSPHAVLDLIRARDTEVRAEELRLAAHELEGDTLVPGHAVGRFAIQYLRDRADRIETGASNE